MPREYSLRSLASSLRSKVTLSASVLLLLLFFALLGQSYFEAKERVRRLNLLETEVETLRVRKAELEEELAYRQSPVYIEEAAREQLGYAKKGEVIVVLPDFEKEKKEENGEVAAVSSDGEGPALAEGVPNWKQWRLLFFGN